MLRWPAGRSCCVPVRPGHRSSLPLPEASPGASDRSKAKAAANPDWLAADIGGAERAAGGNGRNGCSVVLTFSVATASPMERAASSSSGVASRNLACQTGASTMYTSLSPRTFANRACAASDGGRHRRNSWSTASSHKARRNGSPALTAYSASSAARGPAGTFAS
jgi:hypothetical protein